MEDLRKSLGIDEYLELLKEDPNCKGTYISFGQYMYILEKQIAELKEENEILRKNAEHNDKVVDKVNWENKLLKNNWNELKEWLQERKFVYNITGEDLDEDTSITEVLIKLVELEKKEVE